MKRIVTFVLLLLLVFDCAHAAVSVRMDDAAALLTEDGAVIVPAGVYADIVPLGDELFAASHDGQLYALMDGDGAELTDALYDEFRMDGELLLARRDSAWGLMGRDGEEFGAFEYERIEADGEGGRWALRGELSPDMLVLLASDGSSRDSGLYVLRIGEASEGLLPVELDAGRWGCCDPSGELAIPGDYDYIGSFIAGLAPAVSGGMYGAIDRSGEWAVDPIYDFLEISAGGFVLAVNGEGARLMDLNGGELAVYSGEDIYAALAGAGYVIGDSDALRVFDAAGTLLEELAPDAAVSEGVGEQLVLSEGMWGESCVRLLGTDAAYQNLYPLGMAGGEAVYACMRVNAARYENNLLKEIQISVDMDTARYGMVNGSGEQILPCHYTHIEYLSDDRILVRAARQWQMIDSRGKILWYRRIIQTEAPSF